MLLSGSSGGSGPVGLMPPRKLGAILIQRATNETNVSSTCHGTLRSIGFVGIGKTGSLFMQTALELFAHEQLLPATHHAPHPCTVGAMMGWHHASALLWQRAFGPAWFGAFTFALVRNPWTRIVSHWAFHLNSNPLDGGYLTTVQRRAAGGNESISIAHFRSWVRHVRHVHPPNASDSWRFTTLNAHGNEQARGFNASQLSWLVDEHGVLLVNEVSKLEALQHRWPELQARVCGLRSYRETLEHIGLLTIPEGAFDFNDPATARSVPPGDSRAHI